MKNNYDLNEQSIFIDIGSGLGKPLFHVAAKGGVKIAVGIEENYIRFVVRI